MNQFVRTVMKTVPPTVASHVKRCAAMRPGGIGPIGESIGFVATAISWRVVFSGSSSTRSSAATMSIDWKKPFARNWTIGLCAASSGVFPKSMMSPITPGAEYVRMSENSSARTCVTLPESANSAGLVARAKEVGLVLTPGQPFFADPDEGQAPNGERFVRLPFCAVTPEQIDEGVRRLASLL